MVKKKDTGTLSSDPVLRLRPATRDDALVLFEWFNAPDSLAQKLETQSPISWKDHVAWFETRLVKLDGLLTIIEFGGKAAGQVRFTRRADAFEIDIYIAVEYRRIGIAATAIKRAINELGAKRQDRLKIRARVRNENIASIHLFEHLRFVLEVKYDDHRVYFFDSAI